MSVFYGRAARYVAEHRRLAFLGLVAMGLYWVGTQVPVPGVSTDALAPMTRHGVPASLGLYDLFTGGNLGRATIFALGIMPYVTALFIAWLATELGFARGWGARGRRALAWSVRVVALVLGVVQASAIAIWLERQTAVADGLPLVAEPGWSFRLTLVLTVTAVTACLIWLSDEISRRGIGWGVSLLFFAGLAVGLPGAVSAILEQMRAGYVGPPPTRRIRRGPARELGDRRARRSGPVVVPAWERKRNTARAGVSLASLARQSSLAAQ